MKQVKPVVKILTHTPNPERVIAAAAKLCYSPVGVDQILENLDEEKISKFVNNLSEMGHESPLEHVSFTFTVEGISRACSHQIVRHRIASYSQQSQRYVREFDFEYIMPKDIENCHIAKSIFEQQMYNSQIAYDAIVDELILSYGVEDGVFTEYTKYVEAHELNTKSTEKTTFKEYLLKTKENKNKYKNFEKRAIENARYVFPNATETKMVFTMNIRTLLNFLSVRCCNRAQEEIREVANQMLKQLKFIAPTVFKNAGPKCMRGQCSEGELACKK